MANVVDEGLRHSSVGAKKVSERFMVSDECEITTVKILMKFGNSIDHG